MWIPERFSLVLLASILTFANAFVADTLCTMNYEFYQLRKSVEDGVCFSVTEAIELLYMVNEASEDCREILIEYMADNSDKLRDNADNCMCSGTVTRSEYPEHVQEHIHDRKDHCLDDEFYLNMYLKYFRDEKLEAELAKEAAEQEPESSTIDPETANEANGEAAHHPHANPEATHHQQQGQPGVDPEELEEIDEETDEDPEEIEESSSNRKRDVGCETHEKLWLSLLEMYGKDGQCQLDMIYHLRYKFLEETNPCTCQSILTTPIPTTTPPPTPTVMTTTETTTTTSTELPSTSISELNVYTCDKLGVIGSIARGNHVLHPDARQCIDHSPISSEALLLRMCNMTSFSTWKKGSQVMDYCTSLQPYTPIATFIGDDSDYVETTAIFVKCLDAGAIQMAIQYCNQAPEIITARIDDTSNYDPFQFYILS